MVNICDDVAQTRGAVLALTEHIVVELTVGADELSVGDRFVVALALSALVKCRGVEDSLPLLLRIKMVCPRSERVLRSDDWMFW